MADARSIARGAAWNYGAQIVSALAQLAYAAVTARLLSPDAFGVYAAAFGSLALINVIALAGLQQIVGRMQELDRDRLLGLLVYAGLVGAIGAAAAVVTAPLWAVAWNVPAAVPVIHVLAATAFCTPFVALANGVATRLGEFRRLAVVSVTSSLSGMVVGTVAVVVIRAPEALGVAQILGQVGLAGGVLIGARQHFRGRLNVRATLADVRYSSKALLSMLISYSTSIVGKISVSQTLGTTSLGNWNRAEALSLNPFWMLGTAINAAVYPEFRHDIDDRTRTRRVWSDLLAIVNWICVPLGVTVAVLAPVIVPLLLGDRYDLAIGYVTALAIIGCLQPGVFLLVSGFEALNLFGWNWAAYLVALVCNVAGAVTTVVLHRVEPVFAGMLSALVLMHGLQLVIAHRQRLVSLRRIGRHYGEIAGFAVLWGALLWVLVHAGAVVAVSPLLLAGVLVLAAGVIVAVARRPHRFPPLRLARAYDLLPGGTPPVRELQDA